MTELIINKLKPCNCGCQGSDPWHKATYRRTVTKIDALTGHVQLPFSTKPVVVRREQYGATFGAWIVDRDSIVFDKG